MNKLIIGFTGAQCTGKTTLAKWTAEQYPDRVELCVEGARETAREMGISSVAQIKGWQRQWFQTRILERHLDALYDFRRGEKPVLICDRTVIDILAYTKYAQLRGDPIKQEFLDLVSILCMSGNFYTKIIYFGLIEVLPEQAEDGFRKLDNRMAIDQLIKELLRELQIDYLSIPNNWQTRQEFIRGQLEIAV